MLRALLGVTGGIAAYKAAYLASALVKEGAEVRVVMTENAGEFIAPLTFETLTKNPVATDTFKRAGEFEVEHIALAKWADVFIVAPATANFISKAAAGIADDMLTTVFLAAQCVKVIAPAMNTAMYDNAATQTSIAALRRRGVCVMEPGEGKLACGDSGRGRMSEPEEIIAFMRDVYQRAHDMAGVRVLITAGPTREFIDPVRFLSSPSTGRMGYAVAEEAARRGAQVTVISGPTALPAPQNVEVVRVTSAAEMYAEAMARFCDCDMAVCAAAVADYTPELTSPVKLKKAGELTLKLTRTRDILAQMGKEKGGRALIGFAAETNDVAGYAKDKLTAKNADMICANDVTEEGSGFGVDTDHITVYTAAGETDLGCDTKARQAARILDMGMGFIKR